MGQVTAVAQRRWFRRSVAALLVFDLLVASATLGLHGRDRAEVFSADDAIAEFRGSSGADGDVSTDQSTAPVTSTTLPPAADTTAAPSTAPGPSAVAETSSPSAVPATGGEPAPAGAAAAPPFPAEGVYVYDTTGFEEIDALGGSRHDYPAETSIVHRREGCGSTETWRPFEERKDVRQLCAEPGRHRLAWFDATRSFFGHTDTRRFECEDAASAFVAGAQPGDVFEFRCTQEGSEAANRLEIVGIERVVVGGQPVEAVRSKATSTVTGGASGTSTIESWVHPETGLTLKRTSVLDGSSPGPGGSVSYHEEYTLALRSLEPLR